MPLSAASSRIGWCLRTSDRWLRLAVVLALLLTIANVPAVLSQVRPGASLTVVQGSVAVTQSDGTKIFPAGTGLTLEIGDIVGTLERTRAIVTFFSGSEVELGSNTTIVIRRLDRDLLDQANVTVETLSGATLIRVPTENGPNPGVRVLGNNTVAVIRYGEVGHGVDPISNNVTVACVDGEWRCSRDGTTFPNASSFLLGQTALVMTGAGDLVSLRVRRGDSVWDILAEGGGVGQEEGTKGNAGSERSRNDEKKDRATEKEEDSNRPTQPQTFLGPLTATPTPTITPTATSTPRTGAACDTTQSQVGGSGTFLFAHDLGQTRGIAHLEWDAFAAGDQFEILYQGVVLFSTFDPVAQTPFVSGTGSVDRPFGPGRSTVIVIRVTTGPGSTQWAYEVGCLP